MGRRFANLAIDRLIAGEVASAQRAVGRAIRACREAKASKDIQPARVRRVERQLGAASSALAHVSGVANPFGRDEEFLTEEEESAQFWTRQAERDAERAAREAANNPPEGEDDGADQYEDVVAEAPAEADEGGE